MNEYNNKTSDKFYNSERIQRFCFENESPYHNKLKKKNYNGNIEKQYQTFDRIGNSNSRNSIEKKLFSNKKM